MSGGTILPTAGIPAETCCLKCFALSRTSWMNSMGVATVAERYFPRLARWSLPMAAIEASRDEMAIDGRQGNEGTALWLGHRRDGMGLLRTVVRLRGNGIVKAPDYMSISPELINEVADVA